MNTDGFSKKVMEFEIQSLCAQIPFSFEKGASNSVFSSFVLKKSLKIVFIQALKSGSVSVIQLWIYVGQRSNDVPICNGDQSLGSSLSRGKC